MPSCLRMYAPPTPHRLNRLALWAGLWLARAVELLPVLLDLLAADPALRETFRRRLDAMRDTLFGVIAWRAIRANGWIHVREKPVRRHDARAGARVRRRQYRTLRVLFGRLDPRLRSDDVSDRIAALCALHARIDRLVAHVLRRLKRGLRPLMLLVMTRPPAQALRCAAPPASPAFADSS